MILPYLRINSTISRPIIQIIVSSKLNYAIYPALIDSGADYCIFNKELAKSLGIKLQKTKASFRGVSKDRLIGNWAEVNVKIGEFEYKTKAIFADIFDFGHGILGQKGFFDQFNVNLDYKKQTIEIKPF